MTTSSGVICARALILSDSCNINSARRRKSFSYEKKKKTIWNQKEKKTTKRKKNHKRKELVESHANERKEHAEKITDLNHLTKELINEIKNVVKHCDEKYSLSTDPTQQVVSYSLER